MRLKLISLASILLLGVSAATALTLNVEVDSITEMDAYFLQYQNRTQGVQRMNLTVENSGSIGCTYRIKGVFHYGGTTEIRFSKPHEIWPSGVKTAELYFMPENYTGPVRAEVYSYFCEREELVENITYYQSRRNTIKGEIDSETLSANDEGVEIQLPVEEGLLLPRDTPPYWKSSFAEIRNGTATIRYDPPIYTAEEKMNYTVLNESAVVGKTAISLNVEDRKTYWDRLEEKLPRILAILLFFSTILNTKLLFDHRQKEN